MSDKKSDEYTAKWRDENGVYRHGFSTLKAAMAHLDGLDDGASDRHVLHSDGSVAIRIT